MTSGGADAVRDLDERRDERFRQVEALAKRDIERQAVRDHAHARAIEILETSDPLKFILDTFKTQHIGDIGTAEGILIGTANQSIANSKGIQPAVFGESGRGKSHAARAMLHLYPQNYYMVASLSDKALFYLEAEELKPGMTIFSDDARLSEGIEDVIKRSTAFFQEKTVNKVAAKEGGKWTVKNLAIPPRINWLLTSVNSQGSEQLVNRQLGFDVDETTDQDEHVTQFELEKARDGRPEFETTEDVLTCHEIILNIKEDEQGKQRLFTVKIPFAKRIEWFDKANRRNLPLFLDMIKGYAVLNFKQRELVDDALIATEEDFRAAERLYNKRGGFQKLHINEGEKRMLMNIVQNDGELTTDELMQALKLSRSRVRAIAERLETTLPGFYVEKRSENVRDGSDDSKSTTTQRNYYCYSGDVNIKTFGSVVSLKEPTLGDIEYESTYTTCPPLAPHLHPPESVSGPLKKEGLFGEIHQKEANNNNIINIKEIRERADAHEKESIYAHAHAYTLAESVSAHDASKADGSDVPISQSDCIDSSEALTHEGGQAGVSGQPQAPFTTKNLNPDDLLKALKNVGSNGERYSYKTTRALVYTYLTGIERYKQLDGSYFEDTFDFCADTHPEIARALREIVTEI